MKHPEYKKIIDLAFAEDQSKNDITSRLLIDPKLKIQAEIVAKEKGVLCGMDVAADVFKRIDPKCRIEILCKDGSPLKPGTKVMKVSGSAQKILTAERTALNFIQQLSGVASLTAKFVEAVKETKTKILDTRKTVPGLRALQKYAVVCGGGTNHRMNLKAMAMVKDNHLAIAGDDIIKLFNLKSKLPKGTILIFEAKTMKEVRLAIAAGADIILLDNMGIPQLKGAIRFIRAHSRAQIEISGGINLANIRPLAKLDVERISIGALTHSAPALDLSLNI